MQSNAVKLICEYEWMQRCGIAEFMFGKLRMWQIRVRHRCEIVDNNLHSNLIMILTFFTCLCTGSILLHVADINLLLAAFNTRTATLCRTFHKQWIIAHIVVAIAIGYVSDEVKWEREMDREREKNNNEVETTEIPELKINLQMITCFYSYSVYN